MTKMDAGHRIMRVRSSLVLTQPFFGALALRLKVSEDPQLTASIATDGISLIYNPAFVDTQSDAELKGVIVHLIMHCAMGHPWRRDTRQFKTWQGATDFAINPVLQESGFVLPKGLTVRKDLDGNSAEQNYVKLLMEQPPSGGGGKGKGKGKGQGKAQGGQGQGQGNGEGEGGGEGEGQPQDGQGNCPQDQDMPPGSVLDAPQNPGENAKEQETQWKVATAQAANAAKLQGKLPAGLERFIEEGFRNKVDWKSVLRRFMTQVAKTDYSWTRPRGRYMASGIYLPEYQDENMMPEIVMEIDTSGSIGGEEINLFGAEVNSVVQETKPERAHIVYTDAIVQRHDTFERGDDIVMRPKGGGGTDMAAVFPWIEKEGIQPACCIILTDGYTPWGSDPGYPVLWAITTKGIEAPWGESVYVGDDWVQ